MGNCDNITFSGLCKSWNVINGGWATGGSGERAESWRAR